MTALRHGCGAGTEYVSRLRSGVRVRESGRKGGFYS